MAYARRLHLLADGSSSRKTVIVAFMGGVTFAEIAALRYLSSHASGANFIVCASKLINGNGLLQTFQDKEVAKASLGALL